MTPNAHLDHLIAKETYAEMLAALTPRQLAVVALRLDEVPYNITGEILGLSRNTTYMRMRHARHRLRVLFPHIRSRLEPAASTRDGDS